MLPLPLVFYLFELAAELVLLIQGLGQLRFQRLGMIGAGRPLGQLLPRGSKSKILGLEGLNYVGVGAGSLRTVPSASTGFLAEFTSSAKVSWSRAISA